MDSLEKAAWCTDLDEGDLIFVTRPGFVQQLVELADDTFRHVGIVKLVDGDPFVLEAGRAGFRSRPLGTFLAAYESHAVVKLSACPSGCGNDIAAEALRLMRLPTTYPRKVDLFVVGLLAVARHYSTANDSPARASIYRFAERWLGGTASSTTLCASLIVRALRAACPMHQAVIDLRRPKHCMPEQNGPLSDIAALPDDIWRVFDEADQFRLAPANLVSIDDSRPTTWAQAAPDAMDGPSRSEQPPQRVSA